MKTRLLPKKYRLISEYYKSFVINSDVYDFSDSAMRDMFQYESTGTPQLKIDQKINGKYNGFLVGKHWMDLCISQWKEDLLSGIICKEELLSFECDDKVFYEFKLKFITSIIENMEQGEVREYRNFYNTYGIQIK